MAMTVIVTKTPKRRSRVRIDPKNWQEVPDFSYRAASTPEKLRAALPGLLILIGMACCSRAWHALCRPPAWRRGMKGLWHQEAHLFLKQRLALPALLLMAILSITSVWAGMAEIARQKETIARIQPQQANDVAAIAKWVSKEGDAGNAAYYTFHATWDNPSSARLCRDRPARRCALYSCACAHWDWKRNSMKARITMLSSRFPAGSTGLLCSPISCATVRYRSFA